MSRVPASPVRSPVRLVAAILAAAAVVLAGLAGCGRGPAASADGRVTVTWMVGVDYTRDLIQELADDFNRRSKTTRLEIMWVPGPNYQSKLKTLIAAGQPPDLFYCGDVWVAYLLPFLKDVTPFMERDAKEMELDDFYPELLAACRHNGRYYFLPRWFNVSLLYYNKTLFREAGVPFPTPAWTWDDYTSAGVRLTRRDARGKVDIWGSTISPFWWGEWLVYVRQAGGEIFDPAITRCTLDTPQAIRGMQFYFDKIHRLGFAPKPGYEPDGAFVSKRMAMDFGGHTGNWITFNSIPGLDWDIEILPAGPVTRVGGELSVDALGMSRDTPNPGAAWEAVKFISSPDSVRKHVKRGYLSVRKSVAEELIFPAAKTRRPNNVRAAYEALKYSTPVPRSADFIELALEIIQPDIDEMLADKTPPSRVCAKVVRAADTYLRIVASRKAAP